MKKKIRGSFQVFVGASASLLALAAGAMAQTPGSNTWPYATTSGSPVIAVVGDISCQPGETEPAGEKTAEACNNPKTPYTSTSLWQSQEATANQIEAIKPAAVILLGDLQYQVGQYSDFKGSFDLTYGAFKFLQRPAPGNHEFYDEHGATGTAGYGYFSYFNGFQTDASGNPITVTVPDPCPSGLVWNNPNPPVPATAPSSPCSYPASTTPIPQPVPRPDGQAGHFEPAANGIGLGVADGWYSYNIGNWHLISLNIECSTQPGGCSNAGSWLESELAWLKTDLAADRSACTLAYWHQPTFSATNSITQEGETAQAFWELLYRFGADIVLNGHDHLYARYQPLDPTGKPDARRGIREFIVGSGGETLDPIALTPVTAAQATSTNVATNQEDPSGNVNFNALNLQAYTGDYWGVMALTLNPSGYAWDFESALAGPVAATNGPTFPAPNASGVYSDKGSASCHAGTSSN
jgi:hypothetical protein